MGSPFFKLKLLWQFLVYLEKFPYLALDFVTRVNDFMIAGSIIFLNFEEIPSNPQLCNYVLLSLLPLHLHSVIVYLKS